MSIEELIDNLGDNVKSISYNPKTRLWSIKYNSDDYDDHMKTSVLVDFVVNG